MPLSAEANRKTHFLLANNRNWSSVDLFPDRDSEESQELARFLHELLNSSNLVVLTGLGTSLCVKNQESNSVAPTMYDLWREVKKWPSFEEVLKLVNHPIVPQSQGSGNYVEDIELLLSRCQLSTVLSGSDQVQEFIKFAEDVIVKKCRFIVEETDLNTHEQFLRKTARRSTRHPRMKLFTTNYDLCFETAAGRSRFIVVDGFSHTNPQEFDGSHFDYDLVRRLPAREVPDYVPNVFHLYKIHGSVDWTYDSKRQRIRREPTPITPHLVYPRHSKYESSYDQPFLEMMARFQMQLRENNAGLLVVGFGFNDFHITQPILAAIESNVSLKCMIVSPSLYEPSRQNASLSKIERLIKSGDRRLAMLSCGFEELVSMIPDLVSFTEEEYHRERLLKAGKGL